jgi:flagellar protein FlaI
MIQALDILCIQKMIIRGDRRVRRLDSIIEFIGIDPKTQDMRFNELYTWDPKNDTFRNTGKSFVLEDIMERRNWDEQQVNLELENRKKVLEYMVEKEMDEYEIVSLIQSYYADAGKTMKFIVKI